MRRGRKQEIRHAKRNEAIEKAKQEDAERKAVRKAMPERSMKTHKKTTTTA